MVWLSSCSSSSPWVARRTRSSHYLLGDSPCPSCVSSLSPTHRGAAASVVIPRPVPADGPEWPQCAYSGTGSDSWFLWVHPYPRDRGPHLCSLHGNLDSRSLRAAPDSLPHPLLGDEGTLPLWVSANLFMTGVPRPAPASLLACHVWLRPACPHLEWLCISGLWIQAQAGGAPGRSWLSVPTSSPSSSLGIG